jgi:hypothetical protein
MGHPVVVLAGVALVGMMVLLAIVIWNPWWSIVMFSAGGLVSGAVLGGGRGAVLAPLAALCVAVVDLARDGPINSIPGWIVVFFWLAFSLGGIVCAPLGAVLARRARSGMETA